AGLVAAVWHLWGGGGDATGPLLKWAAPALGLGFLGITGALLVADLKRPERFWTILVRPQWRSWLARGAFVITAYGAVLAGWAAASWLGADRVLDWLAGPLAVLAIATAVYTAALFNQCEGRDLWQSPLLGLHLAVHAPVAALAGLLVLGPVVGDQANLVSWGELVTGGLLLAAVLALVDGFGRHRTANASAAARALVRGPFASWFWTALIPGAVVPAVMLAMGPTAVYPVAAALALLGLWLYGHALVLAGQGPPIS
ncbi:MAG: NrfD/PsrC family molybdoenzyme membrane anchor subunit, partial [Gemmatimonadales bacterium]